MNPNSLKNLIPANRRSREELREMGRKGGKASALSRRERKKRETTITVQTSDGATFKIKGKTPYEAAEAAARLETSLYVEWLCKGRISYGDIPRERRYPYPDKP